MRRRSRLWCVLFATVVAMGCGKKETGPGEAMSEALRSAFAPEATPSYAVSEYETVVPDGYYSTVAEVESKTPQVTVDQMLSDPALIDRKYCLREIELSGVVIRTGRDEAAGGAESAWLGPKTGEKESSVICRFRTSAALAKVAAGQEIIIRGRLGRNMAQALEDCEVAAQN